MKLVSLSPEIPLESARQARNNWDVFKWCRQVSPISPEEQQYWFDTLDRNKNRMFSIYWNASDITNDDIWVGVCGLTNIDWVHKKGEFSLYIEPGCRGNGYARDALCALINHGFRDLNLERIWGEMFEDNPAENLFLSLGMKLEGALRNSYYKNGEYIGSYIFSILRDEWKIYFNT